jgi:chromosome segregation ATPase
MPSRESAASRFVREREREDPLAAVVTVDELLELLEQQSERIAELELQLDEASRARHVLGQKLMRERSARDEASAELHVAKARAATLEDRLNAVSERLKDAEAELARCRRRGLGRFRRRAG